MLHYEFPIIRHIDDVLPAIAGRDEFIVVEREYGHVINYLVNVVDTFPNPCTAPDQATAQMWAMRRECRGLVFDTHGQISSRAFHKFFNVNERDETQLHHLDLAQPHVILEKLDGSMVRPIRMNSGGWRLGTKMGVTDVSNQAEAWVCNRKPYVQFITRMINENLTPIFEWCSRQQRIVIDYPVDRLVLTAVRDNYSGAYVDLGSVDVDPSIEVVEAFTGTVHNMQHLVEQTRVLNNQEGWVVRFANGHMIKIKADLYVQIHKAKDQLTHEKNVIGMIINEQLDDVKAALPDHDRERLDRFESAFWTGVSASVHNYQNMYDEYMVKQCNLDRKQFAINCMQQLKDPFAARMMFSMLDCKDTVRNLVVDIIGKHLASKNRVDLVRPLFNASWNYAFDGDA